MQKRIAVLGGDARSAALARLLSEDGYTVGVWGLPDAPQPLAPEQFAAADIVILPVPLSCEEGFLNSCERLSLDELWKLLCPGQRIYAGSVSNTARASAARHGLALLDYFANEELAVRNAIPTAEGAIETAMAALPVTLHRTPCLVVGFGRIGKLLAHRLRGLGAEVAVSARRRDDLAWIDAFGYRPVPLRTLPEEISGYRVLFNTVPQPILGAELLEKVRRDCVLVELASRAGIDEADAHRQGLCCIRAGGLPGKYAPETSAHIIQNILYQMWEDSQ